MKPFLLFDFDGTIADSFHLGITIANRLAPEYGLKQFSEDDFKRFRSLPMHKVLKEFRIPFYKIPGAIKQALHEYHHLLDGLEPCSGVLEMLSALKAMQIPMALLSSNNRDNLMFFLQRYQIDAFDWVEGTSGILKKANRICQQLKKHGLKPSEVVYIGDEVRDIEAAKKCGIKMVAVSWGFQTTDLLCSHTPDYLVHSPQQIVDLAIQLNR